MIITCDICKYQNVCSTNSECVLVAKKYEPCFIGLTLNGEPWLEGDYYERDMLYERNMQKGNKEA